MKLVVRAFAARRLKNGVILFPNRLNLPGVFKRIGIAADITRTSRLIQAMSDVIYLHLLTPMISILAYAIFRKGVIFKTF
jgi:hypothetical protein